MKQNQFQLLDFKYDDKGLIINYVLDPGGIARGGVVAWSKNEHNIPNSLVKVWREASLWIAAIEGRVPAIILENQFGHNAVANRNKVDKMTKEAFPERQTFGQLDFDDYINVARLYEPTTLKLDEFETGVQLGYEFKYLDFKAKQKRKTPMICIDHNEVGKASQLQDKFKFALFPWFQELSEWVDAFTYECYLVAKQDAEVKARYVAQAKQLSIEEVTNTNFFPGQPSSDFDRAVEDELAQGANA